MIDQLAGNRYAGALFHLALESNALEKIEQDFAQAVKTLKERREISRLISNPTISLKEKESFIAKIFSPDTEKLLINFMRVIIKNGHFREIFFIRKIFHELFEKKLGIEEVFVITARALPETHQGRLAEALAKKLRSKVRLITKTDPKILGGMILRVKNKQIDGSFKRRLQDLRELLV